MHSKAAKDRCTMHILGIELAKHSFDVTLLRDDGDRRHKQFANTPSGFTEACTAITSPGIGRSDASHFM